MKKGDLLYFAFAVFALLFAMYTRFNSSRSDGAAFQGKNSLQLIGVLRDIDCIECLEKVLCSFTEMEKELIAYQHDLEAKLLFANEEGTAFDLNELSSLCPVPKKTKSYPYDLLDKDIAMPFVTPAMLLVFNGRIVSQETIFVDTDVAMVSNRFASTIRNLQSLGVLSESGD